MSANLISAARMLRDARKRPEEVFDWYRRSEDHVDQASAIEWHYADERDETPVATRTPAMEVVVTSASAYTLERFEDASARSQRYLDALQIQQGLAVEAAVEGRDFKERPIPEPPALKGRALEVLTARLIAEGVVSWDPAPRACVAVPSLGIKRGDELPIPGAYLPDDPEQYDVKSNGDLMGILRAIPARLAQKVWISVAWTSVLDFTRFFPTEEEAEDDAKLPPKEREGIKPPPGARDQGKS